MSECERCGTPVTGLDRYCDDCIDAGDDSTQPNDASQSTTRTPEVTRQTGATGQLGPTRLLGIGFLGIAMLATGWTALEYAGRYVQHFPMRYSSPSAYFRSVYSVSVTMGLTVFYGYLSIALYRDDSAPARFAQLLFILAGLSFATNLLVDILPFAISQWIPIVPGPGYVTLSGLYQLAIPQPPVIDWLVDYTLMAFAGAAMTAAVALRFKSHQSNT